MIMHTAALLLILASLALGGFAIWGVFTDAGQRRYDEMDGLYVYFAGLLAVVCFFTGCILLAIAQRRSRRIGDKRSI